MNPSKRNIEASGELKKKSVLGKDGLSYTTVISSSQPDAYADK